ncbi:MAG: helix-turn-helix domain-containing protein [Psychrosphaera sp.]|nr:helix-turn-helix domain-containing protein [Psychrosphaera sp.]
MSLFAGVGITLALFFGLLLLTKRGACTADRWLSAWFFTLFFHAAYILAAVEQASLPVFVAAICHPLFLLYGPIILSYVMQVSAKQPISFWHFVPYGFFAVSLFVVGQFGDKLGVAISFEGLNIVNHDGSVGWLFLLLNASMGLYLLYPLLAIKQLKRHKKQIESHYSDLTQVELHWTLVWIGFSLLGVVIAITVSLLPDNVLEQQTLKWIVFGLIDLQMLYAGIKGLQQTQIFVAPAVVERTPELEPKPEPEPQQEQKKEPELATKPKSQTPKPVVDLSEDIAFLTGFMQSSKPYLENSLVSEQLANRLKWSTAQLTQVINQGLNQSFFEFINRYRIEDAKAALVDPKYKNCTILAVAYDAGFNSKTSFNNAFKKYQGMTPSAFKKDHVR